MEPSEQPKPPLQPPPIPPGQPPVIAQAAATETKDPRSSLRKGLALASILTPIAAIGFHYGTRIGMPDNQTAIRIGSCFAILVVLCGLAAGIAALRGTGKYKGAGITGKATTGIFINSMIIMLTLVALKGFIQKSTRTRLEQADHASLLDARRGFSTKLLHQQNDGEPAPDPPAGMFHLVKYPSPAGDLAAYVSPSPNDGRKHPAIIWLFGGFGNGISEIAWDEESLEPGNDQSGSAFRKAGILMMYPSLRGGNDNPGFTEGFYGEVDDVLAARDYLAALDYVDPQRIYLGGHSTGGTLALLAAESSEKFRAVFAFGPVKSVSDYGADNLPFKVLNFREVELRSPARWLYTIRTPTFVIEGISGNVLSLIGLSSANRNRLVRFYSVKGHDHFSILAPATKLLATKILQDNQGSTCNIVVSDKELAGIQ